MGKKGVGHIGKKAWVRKVIGNILNCMVENVNIMKIYHTYLDHYQFWPLLKVEYNQFAEILFFSQGLLSINFMIIRKKL